LRGALLRPQLFTHFILNKMINMENLNPIHQRGEEASRLSNDREQFGIVRLPDTLWSASHDDDGSAKLA
jgi:hypothetical protein